MKKTEWIEEHNKDIEDYDKSIIHHDLDESMQGYYEYCCVQENDNYYYGRDDWYEPMGHFKD